MPTQKELESPSAEDCSQAEAYNPEGVFAIQVGMLRSHFYYRLRLVAGISHPWGYIKVIKRFPRHFAEIYKYAPNESKHLPLFEDLHRAYAVLRMWYHLDTENKKTKLRWAPSKEQCRPALTIHYLDSYEPPKKELTDVAKLATKNPVPENQAKEKEYRHRSDQELKKKNDYYRYFMNRHLKSTEDDMFNKILSSEVHRHYL
ncbi:hypothetical protein MGYG_06707 [Nannizzia gypsea CBS 118893]|uniref:Uncharacterized protein n=1 Tax=Arthroderma gypseum (strain ATCC MYA-4604 / CBS 118893) TaxID=535722 RepID=E4V0Z5_ARTGP|nr:hypothetical protein MGYG_06707 [Nannizzia gypsea CBS 118893]EFR03710.1 hypothetical protein MGYG_06707 [Nannizzia gypsea CBS 118893]